MSKPSGKFSKNFLLHSKSGSISISMAARPVHGVDRLGGKFIGFLEFNQ